MINSVLWPTPSAPGYSRVRKDIAKGNVMSNVAAKEPNLVDINPYLNGIYAPVAEETTILDCKVEGEVPRDLFGAYCRNGPNPAHTPANLHHWFDGDGMIHAVHFENGKAEYRNRYIRCDDYKAEVAGTLDAGGVLLPANRARELVYKDTANTDLVFHNGSLMALWYVCGKPMRVDARTLTTIGNESFGGKLPRHVSAHGKVDTVTGDFAFFDYALYEPWMAYGVVDKHNVLKNFQHVELPGPRLPHDMGLTENYVILHDLPVVFTQGGLRNSLWRIEQQDRPARFGVAPRNGRGDAIKWFEAEPCYIYHVANAWEEGDEVVMHACKMIPNGRKPNAAFGPYAPMAAVLALHAVPVEWRMNVRTGAIRSRQLDDRLGEFPVINNRFTGRRSRYSYNVSIPDAETLLFDGIHKYDLGSGARQTYRYEAGVFGSEPAFAQRIGGKDEDDGYLVVFTIDENDGNSEVQILDAKDIAAGPIGRVRLPCRVPAGFHATWAPGEEIAA
jgi:carotenoid cleavage dioxygenase-like enzyme